jgi:hypothetical protein
VVVGTHLEALTEKFGAPSSVSDDTVQNRMGATFPQKTYRWSNARAHVPACQPKLAPELAPHCMTLNSGRQATGGGKPWKL